MKLSATVSGRGITFGSLAEVMAKANEEKSGDRLAGLGAESAVERVAAKRVLADLTLQEIRENPLIAYETDAVTRLIEDDLNRPIYEEVKGWTVGQLREAILDSSAGGPYLLRLGRGLNSEMIAAVTKLMTNLDLIAAARRIRVLVTCNNTIGGDGVLGVRCQPNHPTDSLEGILASALEGLSYGCGDAVIGVNPVRDTPEWTRRVLDATAALIDDLCCPTQNCVLAHITTQMKALEQGARLDLMFQSLAGTEAGNRAFGIDIPMLEEGWHMARTLGRGAGANVMYFETGEGSELSSNSHHGVDQLTLEARCYGLARHFKPFLVNTVVGFIGPEYLYDSKQIIRAGLEDHFMGKLHGLPMGCDACYTNHCDADQNDLESLMVLLASAGCNFFMGLPMGDDVMLNYQSSSFHDDASVREVLRLRPAPEFDAWCERMGILEHGRLTRKAGDPTLLGASRR